MLCLPCSEAVNLLENQKKHFLIELMEGSNQEFRIGFQKNNDVMMLI